MRVIGSTKPATTSPFVASTWVPTFAQDAVKNSLLKAHDHLPQLFTENGFSKFVSIRDGDYNNVRESTVCFDMNNKI